MISRAYVLIETEVDKTNSVVISLRNLEEVKSVHAVTGPFDIIAFLETDNPQKIGDLILQKIRPLSGMKHTLTCMVFD